MNQLFIITLARRGAPWHGEWRRGQTLEQALDPIRAIRRFETARIHVFRAAAPFAPADRPAADGEADAWVNRDGGVSWQDCEHAAATVRCDGSITNFKAAVRAAVARLTPAQEQRHAAS